MTPGKREPTTEERREMAERETDMTEAERNELLRDLDVGTKMLQNSAMLMLADAAETKERERIVKILSGPFTGEEGHCSATLAWAIAQIEKADV